ncbi:hypothetical protein AKO1_010631 [Acrasis kona]|uniref:Uncharacterized protein n=1 Tax=Acrasis kona TaxID=1008807 RepID=A0AAW2ZK15_9EUKA
MLELLSLMLECAFGALLIADNIHKINNPEEENKKLEQEKLIKGYHNGPVLTLRER